MTANVWIFLKCHSIVSFFMRSVGSVIHSSFEIQWLYNACSLEREHGQDELSQSYWGDRSNWLPSDPDLLSLGLVHTKEKSIREFLKLDQLEIYLVLGDGRLMRNLSLGLIGLPAHPTCFTFLGSIFRFSLHFLYNGWFGAEVGTVVPCVFSVHIQEIWKCFTYLSMLIHSTCIYLVILLFQTLPGAWDLAVNKNKQSLHLDEILT